MYKRIYGGRKKRNVTFKDCSTEVGEKGEESEKTSGERESIRSATTGVNKRIYEKDM